ncbi:hypothetical protein ABL78_2506 [Leptomonas seymouri]|uniref:Signal peptidase complex subunit 3 n=1 Tax=Leptomonas seymouri TaxID=5684 RepID=A0A0N0P7I7_LEPSE|nr:hypothetical protein ABL78_2506 [Leptomonas seymouri]|eukprot:KPI88387.1 hypothetical protein ABL78_2506 [Leptomonas seymouri]
MNSKRRRLCDIVASSLSVFLFALLLVAISSILRDLLLHPRPIVHDVRVSSTSPLYVVESLCLLSTHHPDAALYYLPSNSSANGVRLPSNIEVIDLSDREGDSEEDRKMKNAQRSRLLPGMSHGKRTTNRIMLYLSGYIDFSHLWDWNTKAIYISFVARFQSPSTTQNEVTFLDAIMRPAAPPVSIARLAALRRREWEAKRELDLAIKSGAASATASVESLLSDAERQQLADYEKTLVNEEHDHPSLFIDHIERILFLNNSFKYPINAFDDISLPGRVVEVVLRYQVMSFSGWAPLREDVLGHQVTVQVPKTAIPLAFEKIFL